MLTRTATTMDIGIYMFLHANCCLCRWYYVFLRCRQDTYINCLQHSIESTQTVKPKDSQSFLFIFTRYHSARKFMCVQKKKKKKNKTCTLFNWLSLCFYFFYFLYGYCVVQVLPRFFFSPSRVYLHFLTWFSSFHNSFPMSSLFCCCWYCKELCMHLGESVSFYFYFALLSLVYYGYLLLLLYLIWMKQW